MHLTRYILIPLRLTSLIDHHDIHPFKLTILPQIPLLLHLRLIIGKFIWWAELGVLTGHDVAEDLGFDGLAMEVSVADYVGTGDMHLALDGFGTGAEDL